MAPWSRTLVALVVDLCSLPSTHMAHDHLQLQSEGIQHSLLASTSMHTYSTDKSRQHAHNMQESGKEHQFCLDRSICKTSARLVSLS